MKSRSSDISVRRLGRFRVTEMAALALPALQPSGLTWLNPAAADHIGDLPLHATITNEGFEYRRAAVALEERLSQAARQGGKAIWSEGFIADFAGLLATQSPVPEMRPDACGPTRVEFRLTPDGVLVGSFEYEAKAGMRTSEAIALLNTVRHRTIGEFLMYCHRTYGTSLTSANIFSYGLVEIEKFLDSSGNSVPISEMLVQPDLVGIANRTTWYQSYKPAYIDSVMEKSLSYRNDELYVVDRQSCVIICEQFWMSGTLALYRHDLALMVSHLLSRLALLKTIQDLVHHSLNVYEIRRAETANSLRRALESRLALTSIQDSLDLARYVNQNFMREFGQQVASELGATALAPKLAARVDQAVSEIGMLDAVEATTRSASLSAKNNRLMACAVALAVLTIIVTVALGVLTLRQPESNTGSGSTTQSSTSLPRESITPSTPIQTPR